MATFLERAKITVEKGAPVIRLKPKTKIAIDAGWQNLATTDETILAKWSEETPDANCAAVAKATLDGVWFLEIDNPEVVSRIEVETNQKLPRTYRVRSRPGRGHFYWKQTPESIALGNVAQPYVKNGDFSVRVNNEYVVSEKSVHPISGAEYEVVSTAPIIEAPSWLIDWVKSQKQEKKQPIQDEAGSVIPDGQRNSTLASIAGKYRSAGANAEEIEMILSRINQERCVPPLHENDIRTIAYSIARYPVQRNDQVLIGGVPVGQTAYGVQPAPSPVVNLEEITIPDLALPVYPKFPRWVMEETSIYTGLVKPFCDINSRYPEYMFMPAMALLLNCVATRVHIKGKMVIPSLFMVLIGKRGEVIKSSSVQSAIEYFQYAGLFGHATGATANADGRSLVWEVGSPEGLGIEMSRMNCRNAVLFYDELATLANKATIESSTLNSRLLTMYESGKYQNTVKSRKDNFSFEPNTYCVSLIACSTDKNFLPHWAKLSGKSSGLDDRFFFLFQPETLLPLTPHLHVYTQEAANVTRRLVDNAIKQGTYVITNDSPLVAKIGEIGNRAEIRAEKFALAFAIDLGKEEIDLDCIERGLALIAYEKAVKKWLRTYEADTREGAVQMSIKSQLMRCGGRMGERELKRQCHADRIGTTAWNQAFHGLIKDGQIVVIGDGVKGSSRFIQLLVMTEDDD